jgi:glycosyltransferase involved in cell wall biosynthesis
MTQFTVILPTHDHVDTLWFSIESVLAQTVRDFELIVVGDGAPPRTAEIVAAIAERDPRVRYVSNPKGERHGELSRHAALQHARGCYVAYQCDDDLWFPDHLETLAGLLADHDLAHSMQIDVTPEGHADTVMFDARNDANALKRMRRNEVGFGLASGGHTIAAYRRLPYGWRPAPKAIHSDLHFWLQFLDEPWCRYGVHRWPDVVHSAGVPPRWTASRRAAELAGIAARLGDPVWREQLVRRSLNAAHDRMNAEMREIAATLTTQAYRRRNRYALGERLIFARAGNAFRYKVNGAYPPEGWGSWARGALRICLPVRAADRVGTVALRVVLELVHLVGVGREVSRVRVAVNGSAIAEIEERLDGPCCYEISVPPDRTAGRSELLVEIDGIAPATPRSLGMNDDRALTVGIVALTIERCSEPPR